MEMMMAGDGVRSKQSLNRSLNVQVMNHDLVGNSPVQFYLEIIVGLAREA